MLAVNRGALGTAFTSQTWSKWVVEDVNMMGGNTEWLEVIRGQAMAMRASCSGGKWSV